MSGTYYWLRSEFKTQQFNCFNFAKIYPIDQKYMIVIAGTKKKNLTAP